MLGEIQKCHLGKCFHGTPLISLAILALKEGAQASATNPALIYGCPGQSTPDPTSPNLELPPQLDQGFGVLDFVGF